MASPLQSRFARALVLAVATATIAAFTLFASLAMFHLRAATGNRESLGSFLGDPMVLEVGFVFATLAAAIAYPFMVWLLMGTQLHRSVPVVGAVTVATTSLLSFAFGPIAMLPGLLVGLGTMVACRKRYRIPQTFPRGLTEHF